MDDGIDEGTLGSLLPPAYAAARLLAIAGCDDDRIASQLGLPPEAVSTLLELGRRKLARLVEAPDHSITVSPTLNRMQTWPAGAGGERTLRPA